jgi:hypothetical protein
MSYVINLFKTNVFRFPLNFKYSIKTQILKLKTYGKIFIHIVICLKFINLFKWMNGVMDKDELELKLSSNNYKT